MNWQSALEGPTMVGRTLDWRDELGFAAVHESQTVQVFGRQNVETIHALFGQRPKSAKAGNRGSAVQRDGVTAAVFLQCEVTQLMWWTAPALGIEVP
jgi:hypothetical protein